MLYFRRILASPALNPYFNLNRIMTLHAYAKINIGLHILSKRSDGYHNLETVFREIDLFDVIELEPSKNLEMTADSILVPVDETNLCLKAAKLLQEEKNVEEGASIHLKKNIPIGAGLGGGSSNAAAVLRGLNKMWELKLTSEQLADIAAKVSSDAPFFVEGGSAFAGGKGDVLEHFTLSIPFWIAVVTPPINISTVWAYRNLKSMHDGKPSEIRKKISKQISSPSKLTALIQNDFEPLIFETFPDILHLKEKLTGTGAVFAMLSGSGSSVFGFFEEEQTAIDSVSSFPKNYQSSITAPSFKPIR
jgi:4-diphosphocytidyl-2-C-methyl-D-erythritol kinase